MIRKYLFLSIWVLLVLLLCILGINYRDKTKAMVAQVENQVTVISFQKPIRIIEIFVVPGQEVHIGDKLFIGESQTLMSDIFEKKTLLTKYKGQFNGSLDQFQVQLTLTKSEVSFKVAELQQELNALGLQKRMQDENSGRLSKVFEGVISQNIDSIQLARISFLNQQIENQSNYLNIKLKQLRSSLQNDTSSIKTQIRILENEIGILENESLALVQYAEHSGNIGNVSVQLNELVPPYQSILSIYGLNPSIIKAFVNERSVVGLELRDKVLVESTNRMYKIPGEIIEIGSRVTSFPEKLNVINGINSFGQEIFIKISEDNNFLNGEKVYVYLNNDTE